MMKNIVNNIIDFTNDKTPIYKIIYAEPEVQDEGNYQELSVNIKTIILDFQTWKGNIAKGYTEDEWDEEETLEKWNEVIDKSKKDIDRQYLTGQLHEDNNIIWCRKLSVELLN